MDISCWDRQLRLVMQKTSATESTAIISAVMESEAQMECSHKRCGARCDKVMFGGAVSVHETL